MMKDLWSDLNCDINAVLVSLRASVGVDLCCKGELLRRWALPAGTDSPLCRSTVHVHVLHVCMYSLVDVDQTPLNWF